MSPEDPPRLDRRTLLRRGLGLAGGVLPTAVLLNACGGDGMMGRRMPEWMMSGDSMMDRSMMKDMQVIRELLQRHEEIERKVKDIPDGVRARTASDDPGLAELIRTHVSQMDRRLQQGRPIRMMDPVFREIFDHHDEIDLDARAIAGGVLVVETSQDPQVELLIRAHAHRAVSEFVADGMSRAMRPTPLPDGYRSPA